MSEMVERVASSMYWRRVDPDRGAVASWPELPDEHRSGTHLIDCKAFWRESAVAAIEAMREPTEKMLEFRHQTLDVHDALDMWKAMLEEAVK